MPPRDALQSPTTKSFDSKHLWTAIIITGTYLYKDQPAWWSTHQSEQHWECGKGALPQARDIAWHACTPVDALPAYSQTTRRLCCVPHPENKKKESYKTRLMVTSKIHNAKALLLCIQRELYATCTVIYHNDITHILVLVHVVILPKSADIEQVLKLQRQTRFPRLCEKRRKKEWHRFGGKGKVKCSERKINCQAHPQKSLQIPPPPTLKLFSIQYSMMQTEDVNWHDAPWDKTRKKVDEGKV